MGPLSHHPYQASAPTRLTRVKCRRWGVQTHGPDQPYQPLAARLLFFSNVCRFAWVSDHGAGAHARQHGQAREEARRNEGTKERRWQRAKKDIKSETLGLKMYASCFRDFFSPYGKGAPCLHDWRLVSFLMRISLASVRHALLINCSI